ncbi:MAG TPA: hypothetical protein VG478_03380 [Acidimicrobiales bacterium]|nr:hypothetical protein [Acidimicrobiales bacterium]
MEGLTPGSTSPYEVHLDGERCWPPPDARFPPSVIRTLDGGSLRILFGSCRAAAPHEPPWSLESDHDQRARGVDALHAHGLRMLTRPSAEWPHLLVFVGDQVYADDSSPETREKVKRRRGHLTDDDRFPPLDDVADFEEYTWLYHESWRPEVERWVLSVVPSAMIFDDHDMVDDWNTSRSWLEDIRRHPWWEEHVTGGLMSYWVYQHLGNLSPREIRTEGMLERFVRMGDATAALTQWARDADTRTPGEGGYRFSFWRDLGPVRLVVIDCRQSRVLDPGARRMIDETDWAWVVAHADVDCEHLVLATSVPVALPGGVHDLEQWDERVANGAWGKPFVRAAEMVRRALDLEDWSAFHTSYVEFMDLLHTVATRPPDGNSGPPATVLVLSGDVHFSYRARATCLHGTDEASPISRVHQIVNSPIRNVLAKRERRVISLGLSRVGSLIGRALRRASGARRHPARWTIKDGPFFANHMCELEFKGRAARMVLERAEPDDEGQPRLTVAADSEL